jgi:hypothetical protein
MLQNGIDLFSVLGSTKGVNLKFLTGYLAIEGGLLCSDPPSQGNSGFDQLADDVTINIEDNNLLTIDADVAAKTLTIDHTDHGTFPQTEGVKLTVSNTGSVNFTLACDDGAIDGTTIIVAGNRYVYYVNNSGGLVEESNDT